jgi:hypothetical protein
MGAQSTAAGPVRLGAAAYYLTRSGQPAATYAAGGQAWRAAALPGTATAILGADAYQTAGQPSWVFLSGPPGLDEARDPGSPWAAQSLAPSSGWLRPAALGLAALFLACAGLVALWLVRRRLAGRLPAAH